MMGRFSLSGSAPSNASTSNTSSSSSSITSSLGSMANISIPNMKLKEMTKKMSVGLNISAAMGGQEVKTKQEAEERKMQISQTLATLEDISLQSPASHSGLILAYTSRNSAPVMSPGIKFRWFRMKIDQVEPVEESFKAWYSPTVDDVGCMICVQCEDNFDQGCSRYLECGPLKADPLLQTVAESAINSGVYEIRGVSVSLGLAASDSVSSIGAISEAADSHAETVSIAGLSTVLSKERSFLQLNGFSTIEVDEKGIFISIPTAQIKGKDAKHSFNTSRRGLRIAASAKMHVSCAQPQSLVLTLPIKHRTTEMGEESPITTANEDDNVDQDDADATSVTQSPKKASEEDKMKEFLSSSIVAIPWSYEGHNLSPQAYITENESKLSVEERERILREAEEDSINFANTVCALAEFISSLPEGTNELLLCFGCTDRISRDTLAVSMRALACHPEGTTRHDRRKVLPWLTEGGEANLEVIAGNADVDIELKKRLKQVEEENGTLKRERNELTKQLVDTKEEISAIKSAQNRLHRAPSTHDIDHHHSSNNNYNTANATAAAEEDVSVSTSSSTTTTDIHATEQIRELSSKVIELENRLSITLKKEVELEKARNDVESKNSKMMTEIEKLKKVSEDATTKANTVQTLYDHQSHVMAKLELEQEQHMERSQELEQKAKEARKLEQVLQQRDDRIAELTALLQKRDEELQHSQQQAAQRQQHYQHLQDEVDQAKQQRDMMQQQFDAQLTSTIIDNKRLERELNVALETTKAMEAKVADMRKVEDKLKAAEEQIDILQAEMNHLQRKSESQTRDMKKTMKENASTLLEFEKALARKSGECNEAYMRIQELEDALRVSESLLSNSSNPGAAAAASASAFIEKVSSSIQQRRPSLINLTAFSSNSEGTEQTTGEDEDGVSRGRALSSATSAASSAASSLFRRLSVRTSTADGNSEQSADS